MPWRVAAHTALWTIALVFMVIGALAIATFDPVAYQAILDTPPDAVRFLSSFDSLPNWGDNYLAVISVQLEKALVYRQRDPQAADKAEADARHAAREALHDVRQSVGALRETSADFVLADALHDDTLRNIGTRQLEYIVGYNPFAMSTIYGDGYNYPPLYGAYAGDVVGAVPVGIETFENEDAPYMPMQVNATYKEIWTNSTGNVIWLLSKIMKE